MVRKAQLDKELVLSVKNKSFADKEEREVCARKDPLFFSRARAQLFFFFLAAQ